MLASFHGTRPLRLAPAALIAAGCLIAHAPARADAPPPDGTWVGAGQAGLLVSSGNSEATSANAKLDLARTDGPWKNTLYLGGLYAKSAGIVSGERIEGRYQLDHKVTDDLFWFAGVDAIRDLFSGFDYQATLSAGAGYRFINNDSTKLTGTLGVGYQRLETQTITKDASGEVISRVNGPAKGDLVGTAGLNFEQKLGASTKLTDKLFVTSGSLNTAVANDLALAVNLNSVLALSVGYGIRYNTDPASGVKKLDQVETLNLVYNIK